MGRIKHILFFSLLLNCAALIAQSNNSYYTILVGTFSGNRPENYKTVEQLGFLFAKERSNQVFDVYIGGYDTALEAATILDQVKKAGFSAAKIQQYVVRDNQSVTSIQITSFDAATPVNWARYQQLNDDLYVIPNADGAKLLTGFYPSLEVARKELPRIQALGFADAFVRTAHPTFLHQIGGFETGTPPKNISATAQIGPKKTNVNVAKPTLKPQPTFLPVDYQLNPSNNNVANIPGVNNVPAGYSTVPPPNGNTNARTAPAGNGQFKWDNPGANTNTAKGANQIPVSYEASNNSYNSANGNPPSYNYSNAPSTKGGNVQPGNTNNNQVNPLNAAPIAIYRASVKDLQQALVQEGAYRNAVDGFYNPSVEQAWNLFQSHNRVMSRYTALVKQAPDQPNTENSKFNTMLNHLDKDANPSASLVSINHPLSKAYLAYYSFTTRGPGFEPNNYMNVAIRDVFSTRNVGNQISFDSRAVYTYTDLRQVILHLYYLHAALGQEYPLPCWLNDKHPQESAEAQGLFNASSSLPLPTQACDDQEPKQEEAGKVLQLLSEDIGVEQPNETLLKQATEHRALLFAGKIQLSANDQTQLDTWSLELMNKLNIWAAQDPMHGELVRAFRVVFYQTQMELENHFINRGLPVPQARYLALAIQHTLTSPYLQRFE